jgi:uncharacterized membrane protein (UPF0182 family)
VIPIKDSLIYVEPVYLVSANSQLPELKIIIVAYQDRLGFAPTLEEALRQVFGKPGTKVALAEETSSTALPSLEDISRLIERALENYDAAVEKLQQGDFASYGELIMRLRADLEELSTQSKAQERQ